MTLRLALNIIDSGTTIPLEERHARICLRPVPDDSGPLEGAIFLPPFRTNKVEVEEYRRDMKEQLDEWCRGECAKIDGQDKLGN